MLQRPGLEAGRRKGVEAGGAAQRAGQAAAVNNPGRMAAVPPRAVQTRSMRVLPALPAWLGQAGCAQASPGASRRRR